RRSGGRGLAVVAAAPVGRRVDPVGEHDDAGPPQGRTTRGGARVVRAAARRRRQPRGERRGGGADGRRSARRRVAAARAVARTRAAAPPAPGGRPGSDVGVTGAGRGTARPSKGGPSSPEGLATGSLKQSDAE